MAFTRRCSGTLPSMDRCAGGKATPVHFRTANQPLPSHTDTHFQLQRIVWVSSCRRFANPVDLNGAAGWLMINGPDDVRHVCASNVRNYTDRYLPDIYKWVTNEKGILGSQGNYNKRHRMLCQPTFRKPSLLDSFSAVVASK